MKCFQKLVGGLALCGFGIAVATPECRAEDWPQWMGAKRDNVWEISREKIIEPTNNAFGRDVVWCAPAFANGCIYVRNDEKIICVRLTN